MILKIYKNKDSNAHITFGGNISFEFADGLLTVYMGNEVKQFRCVYIYESGNTVYAYESWEE